MNYADTLRMVSEYNVGSTIQQIAARNNLSYSTCYKLLKNNTTLRPMNFNKRRFNDTIIEDVIKLYTIDMLSSIDIAKLKNVNNNTILKWLRKNNIAIRNNVTAVKLQRKNRMVALRTETQFFCSSCKKLCDKTLFMESEILRLEQGVRHVGKCINCRYEKARDLHIQALCKVSSSNRTELSCTTCKLKNEYILTLSHTDVHQSHNEEIMTNFEGNNKLYYQAIVNDKIPIKDIIVECFNCNLLREYVNSFRIVGGQRYKLHQEAMLKICLHKDIPLECQHCRFNDPRVLTIQHMLGGGNLEVQKGTGTWQFYKNIITGIRQVDDLSILCYNCQHLHKIRRLNINA